MITIKRYQSYGEYRELDGGELVLFEDVENLERELTGDFMARIDQLKAQRDKLAEALRSIADCKYCRGSHGSIEAHRVLRECGLSSQEVAK